MAAPAASSVWMVACSCRAVAASVSLSRAPNSRVSILAGRIGSGSLSASLSGFHEEFRSLKMLIK